MLDENANIAPVSGVVIAGALGFIFVLWLLNDNRKNLLRLLGF